ncbi:hypothetical protein DYBT9275_06053 [Dyadobacter sp. CECT 9275]|uniref:Uncharacterized protein n=1 Tax=Dyadobacter helix TaxID=2822344 RepID=A0A916NP46_9BACT|nr:hypothetical protein DYBT9275_06053 [Dyadobacter sp. CECT 9275]
MPINSKEYIVLTNHDCYYERNVYSNSIAMEKLYF